MVVQWTSKKMKLKHQRERILLITMLNNFLSTKKKPIFLALQGVIRLFSLQEISRFHLEKLG